MQQLFQPTNISPDLRGAFGNGVVIDYSNAAVLPTYIPIIYVSWQVNGNTPLTAFKIDFYKNDGSGDLIYSTGKRTYNCPFYSVDSEGNPVLFTYDVEMTPATGLLNYSEGQMKITQYWGTNAEYSITQASASVYMIRDSLLAVVTGAGTISVRNQTFTGSFDGDEVDGLLWHRWVLKDSSGNVLKDSGRIYGNAEIKFSYDGFLPGTYSLALSGETTVGVTTRIEGGGFPISVNYTLDDVSFDVSATKACDGESAVQVAWSPISSIPKTAGIGAITMDSSGITLPPTAYISWSNVNGNQMSFNPPWTVLISATVGEAAFDYLDLRVGNSVQNRKFTLAYNTWTVENTGTQETYTGILLPPGTIPKPYNIRIAISSTAVHFAIDYLPSDGGGRMWFYKTFPVSSLSDSLDWSKLNLRYIMLEGGDNAQQTVTFQYMQGIQRDIPFNEFVSQYVSGTYVPEYTSETLFMLAPNDEQSYNIGNYKVDFISNVTGASLFRKDPDKAALSFVTNVNRTVTKVLDYQARSQQGPYSYYLYITGNDQYQTTPAISNEVNPCFWNWSILRCAKDTNGNYTVKKTYKFANNVSSGTISNGNRPNVLQNFTRYPLVQISPQNYQSGTLQSLIGAVDYTTGMNEYSDSVSLRNELYSLSTTTDILFLKNRKGDLLQIRPSGEVMMDTMDGTREQAQTIHFPWVETGDATDFSISRVIT